MDGKTTTTDKTSETTTTNASSSNDNNKSIMNINDNNNDDNDLQHLRPQITVLIENPKKSCNWGPLLRCCTAFGISQIFVVGFDKCNVKGSHGASKHVELVVFPNFETAIKVLKNELNFVLYGVLQGIPNAYDTQKVIKKSIIAAVVPTNHHQNNNKTNQRQKVEERVEVSLGSTRNEQFMPLTTKSNSDDDDISPSMLSIPVHCRQFSNRTCLVLEKKTKGLSWELAKHCDHFIHIPHQGFTYDSNDDDDDNDKNDNPSLGRSWLSVEASLSIILHEFTTWAGYNNINNNNNNTNQYHGQKYHVQRINKGSIGTINAEKKRLERKQKREAKEREEQQLLASSSPSSSDRHNVGEIISNNPVLEKDDKNDGDY